MGTHHESYLEFEKHESLIYDLTNGKLWKSNGQINNNMWLLVCIFSLHKLLQNACDILAKDGSERGCTNDIWLRCFYFLAQAALDNGAIQAKDGGGGRGWK